MANQSPNWGFYGRQAELAELNRWMSYPGFLPMAVIGGRGVGKTRLIEEAAKSLRDETPYFYLRLPELEDENSNREHEQKLAAVCRKLADQAWSQGHSDALPAPYNPFSVADQMEHFHLAFDALLKRGAVIVLDEFQNIKPLYLEIGVTWTIDSINNNSDLHVTGKPVFAGSHQQQMLNMLFSPSAALYERVNPFQRLLPLPAPALLEMAADQGWLSRPQRFLTAYAAFGGIPRLWKRLADDQSLGKLPEPADGSDSSWRSRFVTHQLKRLQEPRERFFNTSLVSLSKDAQKIANALSKKPRGMPWTEAVQLFSEHGGEAFDKAVDGLYVLRSHLGIAEEIPDAGSSEPIQKIRLSEQAALFELTVEPHWTSSTREIIGETSADALNVMSTVEGLALERLTREWLEEFRQFDKVRRSVELTLENGQTAEIEVVGETQETKEGGRRWLALCSCKRSSDRHQLKKTREEFNCYLDLRKNAGDEWADKYIQCLLISPEWPGGSPRNDGFIRFGFERMASSLGYTLNPWPVPESPDPDPVSAAVWDPDSAAESDDTPFPEM